MVGVWLPSLRFVKLFHSFLPLRAEPFGVGVNDDLSGCYAEYSIKSGLQSNYFKKLPTRFGTPHERIATAIPTTA